MLKLTDKQREQALVDLAGGESIRSIAGRLGVARSTIRRVLDADAKAKQAEAEKDKESGQDLLAYMDGKLDAFKLLGDYVFNERLNPLVNREELAELPLDRLMRVFSVSMDKILKSRELVSRPAAEGKEVEDLSPLAELLRK